MRDLLTQVGELFDTSGPAVLRKVADVAVIWVVAWISWQLTKRIARRMTARLEAQEETFPDPAAQRAQTIASLIRGVGRTVILVVAVVSTLAQFIAIGPILAAGGIVGLAVSFGSQSLVRDVIAGFFILVENQFGLGDVIEAAGRNGTVEKMTLRVVMLRDVNGVLHVIPNGQITTVSNLTRSWARAVVDVAVSYASDLDRALQVIRDEAEGLRADPKWAARFESGTDSIGVEELTPQAVLIRSRLRTAPGAQWAIAREFRRRIKNRLQAEEIPVAATPPTPAPPTPPAPPSSSPPSLDNPS